MRRALVLVALSACGAPESWEVDRQALCPGPTTLQGIDVYHGDGTIDWAQVAGAGISFAIMKATEGNTFQDPAFPTNWSGTQTNGIVRGAYHFFHPSISGTVQADYYLAYVGALGQPGDLPPVLDLETTDNLSGATTIQETENFVAEIQAKTGLATIIYTSNRVWNGLLGGGSQLASEPLWVANWGVTCPTMPPGWSNFLIWQYSANGTVAGVPSSPNVDMDYFNGSLSDLNGVYNYGPDGGVTLPTDAGAVPSDAAGAPDAAASADAAGSLDAAVATDAASSPDAGAAIAPDAGPRIAADAGNNLQSSGCGCGSTSNGSLAATLAVSIVALQGGRRRFPRGV